MGSVRYKKPRLTARSGIMPAIFPDQKTVSRMNEFMGSFEGRVDRGMELVCLEASGVILEAVKAGAPLIGGVDYAKGLKVGLVKVTGGAAVVIYHDGLTATVGRDTGDEPRTVLYFRPVAGSPAWVSVLERYNPWPASMVPAKPSSGEARVFSRLATNSEVQDLEDRLFAQKGVIQTMLSGAGLKGVLVRKPDASEGIDASQDLAYSVLRAEFGYGGKQNAHWRPAIKTMMDKMPALQKKFVEYVTTGSESVFDLPAISGINSKGSDGKFQDRILRGLT